MNCFVWVSFNRILWIENLKADIISSSKKVRNTSHNSAIYHRKAKWNSEQNKSGFFLWISALKQWPGSCNLLGGLWRYKTRCPDPYTDLLQCQAKKKKNQANRWTGRHSAGRQHAGQQNKGSNRTRINRARAGVKLESSISPIFLFPAQFWLVFTTTS